MLGTLAGEMSLEVKREMAPGFCSCVSQMCCLGREVAFLRNKWVWRLLGFCHPHFAGADDDDIEYLPGDGVAGEDSAGKWIEPTP